MSRTPTDRRKRSPVSFRGQRVQSLYTRRLGDGREVYEAVWKHDGRVRSQVLETTPPNVSAARQELFALRAGLKDTGTGPTLGDLADAHFDDQQTRVKLPAHDRRRRSQRTVDTGRYRFDRYIRPKLGNRRADSLTVLDVAALVRSWGNSIAPATQTGTLNVLSAVLGYGVRQQLLPLNVVRDLHRDDRPGIARTKEPRYLTQDEAHALMSRMSDIYRPVATIMYQLGLRVSEALGLTWADIDFEGGELHVRQQLAPDGTLVPLKTARARRTLPLTADVRRELLAIRNRAAKRTLVKFDRAGRLFPNGERNNCRRAVARAADAARLNSGDGKPVGCHDLRHSFAFHCLVTLGLPVTQVSAYMGHANTNITLGSYGGLTDTGLATANDALVASFGG